MVQVESWHQFGILCLVGLVGISLDFDLDEGCGKNFRSSLVSFLDVADSGQKKHFEILLFFNEFKSTTSKAWFWFRFRFVRPLKIGVV